MRKILICLSCLVALALLSQEVWVYAAGETDGKPAQVEESSSSRAGEYVIGSGDVLEITVWREPMLTGEALVRNDGMISVALLGDVKAAGRAPMDLRDEIQRRLKDFVAEPAVTVTVRTPVSQKFYVIGEVRTPGEYDLIKDLTVVQAIARAGGFTEWAAKDKIQLLRKENGVEKRIEINYKDIVKGKDAGQNQALKANDTIVVP
ncbi:MAG: polysaccharide biosynthesis/export family protein [Anaerolineaceae bacterium]